MRKIMLLAALSLISCKKDNTIPEIAEEIVSPKTGTRTQLTLDSIYLYAKQIYLWNDVLPNYTIFNPREKYNGHPSDLAAFNTELFDIAQLKINPITSFPYEKPMYAGRAKYSYLEMGTTAKHVSTASTTTIETTGDPILATRVFDTGNSKTGYIALSSFPKLHSSQVYLDAAFNILAASGSTNLIIDLRENGGGYIETAEYMADLIIPTTLNGKLMYTKQFNSQMQQGKALILRNQPYLDENNQPVLYKGRAATLADIDFTEVGNTYFFQKKGKLETVKNIYFIVSGSTASASELLINSLKPYFDVKLAGTETYGKPVGFFGITIDKYSIYLTGFLIKNALGSADYFNGMAVDIPIQPNDNQELGNPREVCLNKVLTYIQANKTTTTNLKRLSSLKNSKRITHSPLKIPAIQEMIDHRMKLKK